MLFSLNAIGALPVSFQGKNIIDAKNETFSLVNESKPTVLIFLAALCPCSDSHISHIKSLKEKYPQFQFVGVHSNTDESAEDTLNYFKTVALPFSVIQDEKAKLADEFHAYKTPHAFLISKTGEVLFQGGVTSSSTASKAETFYLQDALEDFKSGREVKTKQARTLGCIISR